MMARKLVYFVRLSLVFREGQQVIVVIGDGKFRCAVKGLLQPMHNGDLIFDAFKESADIFELDVEQEGAAILPADLGKRIAKALKSLEHEVYIAAGHHGPDGIAFVLLRHGDDKLEAEQLIKFNACPDI